MGAGLASLTDLASPVPEGSPRSLTHVPAKMAGALLEAHGKAIISTGPDICSRGLDEAAIFCGQTPCLRASLISWPVSGQMHSEKTQERFQNLIRGSERPHKFAGFGDCAQAGTEFQSVRFRLLRFCLRFNNQLPQLYTIAN
jgi:hypothetical protein